VALIKIFLENRVLTYPNKLFIIIVFMVSEVEEGAVYQIEDVWDGTQWHKSKKMLRYEAGDEGGTLMLYLLCARK